MPGMKPFPPWPFLYSNLQMTLLNCLPLLPQPPRLLNRSPAPLQPIKPGSSTALAAGGHQKETQHQSCSRRDSGLCLCGAKGRLCGARWGSAGGLGLYHPTAAREGNGTFAHIPSNCIIVSWRITYFKSNSQRKWILGR